MLVARDALVRLAAVRLRGAVVGRRATGSRRTTTSSWICRAVGALTFEALFALDRRRASCSASPAGSAIAGGSSARRSSSSSPRRSSSSSATSPQLGTHRVRARSCAPTCSARAARRRAADAGARPGRQRRHEPGERVLERLRPVGERRRSGTRCSTAASRPGEVRVVVAHELGHVAHRHVLEGARLDGAALVPLLWLVTVVARRAAASRIPAALPLRAARAAVLNLARRAGRERRLAPLRGGGGLVGAARRRTTRRRARKLFVDFERTSLQQPNPPTWDYLWLETHPTLAQRIAMVEAWTKRAALVLVAGLRQVPDPLASSSTSTTSPPSRRAGRA